MTWQTCSVLCSSLEIQPRRNPIKSRGTGSAGVIGTFNSVAFDKRSAYGVSKGSSQQEPSGTVIICILLVLACNAHERSGQQVQVRPAPPSQNSTKTARRMR